MCRRVECSKCGRPSFAGCGAHVEQVLRDVAPAERCRCRESTKPDESEERTGARSWLRGLFDK